jgi:two-component system OmpR family response regulator
MLRDGSRARILIVEDDDAVLELITTRLEIAGFRTASVRDGIHAINTMVAAPPPDGVVLDIGLPRMNGFEILRAMSNVTRLASVPVLVLTARHAGEDVKKALFLGAKDYLTKPFDDSQLIARTRRLVRKRTTSAPLEDTLFL